MKMRKLATCAAAWFVVAWLLTPDAMAEEAEEDQSEGEAGAAEAAPEDGGVDEPTREANCTNGVDDDQDGDIDCDDYDCLDDEACYEPEGQGEGEGEPEVVPGQEQRTTEPTAPGAGDQDQEESGDELLNVDEAPAGQEDEEWSERPSNMFEGHGYLRVRGDLFHNLYIARRDSTARHYDADPNIERSYYPPWPADDAAPGVSCDGSPCRNSTLAGMNMRFRFEPVINIGDQVRVLATIDMLDNIVLGSTPEGAYYDLATGSGAMSPWVPLRFFSYTQSDASLRRTLSEAITVRRVWAEVTTPLGELHFGRMGAQWGMGIWENAGNGLDDDYGDTVDRISLAARLWGMMLVPGVEFVSSGATSQIWNEHTGSANNSYFLGDSEGGQPIDIGQLDDVTQYFLIIARQLPREEQEDRMRRGALVINGGLNFAFRNQVLSQERVGVDVTDTETEVDPDSSSAFVLRDAWAIIPDLWFQLYFRGFHFEMELAIVGGHVGNTEAEDPTADLVDETVLQVGATARADYTALNGQLNVGLEFGYASGDAEYEGLTPRQANGSLEQAPGYEGSNTDTLFRFDPAYNVDLILFEQVLGQVAGAYYFRPWVSYDFIRDVVGVRADVIYSLASEPLQTIGNSSQLGVEIDAAIYFHGRSPFNFTAQLQYGVLFPLTAWKNDAFDDAFDGVEYPQTVQGMIAVHF
jgi:uncharacterized protein (TIGR04551 family)